MKTKMWIGFALCLATTLATAAPRILTQSVSQIPVAGSVACNSGGFHTENSYWRVLNLAPLNLPGPIVIDGVQFGIELADAAGVGTTQPVTVRVHTSAGAFPGAARTLRAEQTVQIADQTLTLVTIPFTTPTPPLPVDSIVVLELFTPDGRAPVGHRFFIGSNSAGQSAPGFLSAALCGVAAPTSFAALGFPNIHIILNAVAGELTLAENLACATTAVTNMASPASIGAAQKTTLLGLLKVATANQTGPYRDLGRAAANSVLMRTDGCAMRGAPDTVANQGGTGSDFVLTCPAQATVFACVRDAAQQLTPMNK